MERRSGGIGLGLKQVRLFFELSRADRARLLWAAALLIAVKVSLRLSTLPTTRRWLRVFGARRAGREEAFADTAESVLWAIDTVNPYTPGATCLPRALVAKTLLARDGFDSSLVIGVAKADTGELKAHAWLEREGEVVIGQLEDLDRYARFPSMETLGTI